MNGEGKNADVKPEKQMCAEVNGKPYCAFIHLSELIHNDCLSRPKVNSYHVEQLKLVNSSSNCIATYNIYDSLKVISALSFVGQQGKMKQVTTTTPPSPTRQATVYCISVLRRGFSSPRDVVIISVAGMIRVHEHSVMVFNTEKRFAIYLKGVTKNDKVYNFKQHYVTCIAMNI
ncbi:hypothetical protein T4A_13955 [Trichinella pseudospiralis]|uniref:Uncharacterized protein n=1 Tax=Trichinella pseudospiralis TaxID=6337 RepID=A0A0V1EYT8_TRIPS|nr:hypothetical protein T4A_13955 [Trichinella pseudospiralis]